MSVLSRLARFLQPTNVLFLDEDDIYSTTRPVVAGCEINNVCNAKCSFCGYGKSKGDFRGDPRKKGKLDERVLKHTLRLFSEAGGGVFSLGPILGENTVNPKWIEYIRMAVDYPNIKGVSCFTNGILLDRFDTDEILTSGLTNLTISSSLASGEQYKRLYGVDKFEDVRRNILNLVRRNKELGQPVAISIALRIDKPYSLFFESDYYNELSKHISPDRFSVLETGWDDFRGLISQKDLPKGHVLRKLDGDRKIPCYALYRKLQVLQDGTIQACSCRIEPELWTGNVLDFDRMEDAWKNEELENLREKWADGEVPNCCKNCTHYIPATSLISHPIDVIKSTLRPLLHRKRRIASTSARHFDN